MKGELFEVKTAALLYLRGINNNLEFQLGSNIEQARNFDDIVLKYRTRGDNSAWHTCFIQLKHKERAWLDTSMLTTFDRGGFSLQKYLKSFLEIKSKVYTASDHDLFNGPFENCDFVIYTNAPMVRNLADRRRNTNIGPVKDLLKTSQKNEAIVGFCEETDRDIYRALETSGGLEATEFLRKLTVFSGQPSEDQMDEVIKEELKITCSENMSDVDVIYRFFIEAVKQWWSEDEVNFLSHNSSLLERALDQYKVFTLSSHEKQTHRLNVKFQGGSLQTLKKMFQMNCSAFFISCLNMPVRLGCTKVMQLLREEKGAYTFMGLDSLVRKKQAVIHGWLSGMQPYFVILCNVTDEQVELCDEICNVLWRNATKHVVIVFRQDNLFTKTLKNVMIRMHLMFVESQESIQLSELDQESMNRIMESEISLQGTKITLLGLLREGLREAEDVIKNNLADIMASTAPAIGNELVENTDGCTHRYLERRDVLRTEILKSDRVLGIIAVSNVPVDTLQQLVSPKSRVGLVEESLSAHYRVVAIGPRASINVSDFDFAMTERDFYKLCENHDIVHWINMENNLLIWKRSQGDINTIKLFRQEEKCTAHNPNSTTDLKDPIVVIAEEPSTLKSSLSSFLVLQTKRTHPYLWVIKVNLKDHVSLITETKGSDTDPIAFLTSILCTDTTNTLQRDFLKFCLQYSKNVIVFLDEFHEVPVGYEEEASNLVKCLLQTSVLQVVITTTRSTMEFLENDLNTIAYTTRELSLTKDIKHLLKLK